MSEPASRVEEPRAPFLYIPAGGPRWWNRVRPATPPTIPLDVLIRQETPIHLTWRPLAEVITPSPSRRPLLMLTDRERPT